jgi:hypothetical protein
MTPARPSEILSVASGDGREVESGVLTRRAGRSNPDETVLGQAIESIEEPLRRVLRSREELAQRISPLNRGPAAVDRDDAVGTVAVDDLHLEDLALSGAEDGLLLVRPLGRLRRGYGSCHGLPLRF